MTTEDHQVHHGAAVLQIGTPSSCTTWFLMAPSIIPQSITLQRLLLECSSNESSKKRWKQPPLTNDTKDWHQPMSQACDTWHGQRHTNLQSDISKYNPLNQDFSSQSQTALQQHHRSHFLWYLWVGSVKAEPQWEKNPNLSFRSFVTSEKPILGFYFIAKMIHIYVAFSLTLITFWAPAYPRDVLATCCHHTCQGHGKRDNKFYTNVNLSKPCKPTNYFILSDIHLSMTWRQSFGWMLLRIILLLQKMSTLPKNLWTRCHYLERKDNLLYTSPCLSLKTISKLQENWLPPNIQSPYALMAWKSTTFHSWLPFWKSDVSNCAVHPTFPCKRLPQVLATCAPNLHSGRILHYYDSLWQQFSPRMDPLALEFGIQVNYASPQEHVLEAEHNNRVIKEWVHMTYHHLPYNHLPCIMVKVLVDDFAKKLNVFAAKNGISQYYSPHMILHQQNLD